MYHSKHLKRTAAAILSSAMLLSCGSVLSAPAAAAAEEEKTEFDVVLKEAGSEKIKVIKVVREVVSGLGLKEAKEIVESAPKTIKEGVSKEEAEKIAEQFKAVGATIEIK